MGLCRGVAEMNWIQESITKPKDIAPVLVCYLEVAGPSFFTATYSNGQWYRAYLQQGLIHYDFKALKKAPDFWCAIEPPNVSAIISAEKIN